MIYHYYGVAHRVISHVVLGVHDSCTFFIYFSILLFCQKHLMKFIKRVSV